MNPATDAGLSDKELVEQFRSGRESAFNEIVRRYREKVYWVARRMMGSHEEADDVVQEVFVRAYEHLAGFRAESSLYTWLYRIATNVSLNTLRKNRAKDFLHVDEILETLDAGEAQPDMPVMQQEYETLLERAVETLPAKQKQVFIMKYFDDIPFDEMAKMLNKSVGGLKANYFHAVQKIQKYMRREML